MLPVKTINREIAGLALPAIISNLSVPLLGLSDTAISGHLGSGTYIAAIAVGSMMINTVFWLFGFLRMGTTGLTAQAYGSGDMGLCVKLLQQSTALALLIGAIMVVCSGGLLQLLTLLIEPDPAVAGYASDYFRICIWYSPASLAMMSALGWFLGMQDTVRPMIISIGVNIVNIALSLTLVIGYGLGFKGVAIGTLTANWAGLLVTVWLVWRFMRKRGIHPSAARTARSDMSKFFRVNSDIFFRSACIMGVSLGMTAIGSRIDVTTLAANTIMMQFFIFFSYFMDGLAFTGEALTGRYCGSGDRRMLISAVRHILGWSAVVAAVFFLVYVFGARLIIGLLTDQTDVIDLTMSMYVFVILLPPITVGAFVFDGFFIGLTATRQMLTATSIAAATFFLVALVHPWQPSILGVPTNHLLWIAFLSYLFLRGALLAAMFPRTLNTALSPH